MTLTYQAGSLPGFGWVERVRIPWGQTQRIGQARSESRPERIALPPVVCEVLKMAACRYEVAVADILGDSPGKTYSRPRQFVAWTLYEMRLPDGSRRFSLPQIGRYLRRDHSTILHGWRAHQKRMEAGQ